MSLLFSDGFDRNANKFDFVVASVGSVAGTGRYGTGTTYNGNGGGYGVGKYITASDTVTLGIAYLGPASVVYNSAGGLAFYADGGTVQHVRVNLSSATTIQAQRGDGTVLASATVPTFASTWHYVEAQVKVDNSVGRVIVRVDGVQYIDFTGDTRNGGTSTNIDAVLWRLLADGNSFIDDVYALNSLGSVNNTFLGEIRVQELVPTGAGSSTQFTPTAGSNFTVAGDNNDATYNSSATSGQRDTYAMTDLTLSGTIIGLVQTTRLSKSDAGAVSGKPALKSSATIAYGATVAAVASPANAITVWETDPATGVAWTGAGVNAVEAGVEVA